MPEELSTREFYGKTLVELGKENPDIVVVDADLSRSTMTMYFAAEFPDRFFNCGIAEQNMIGIASGLAASGKIPFASTFAVFAPGRCFDQVRMSIAQPWRNVKLVTTHGGITVGIKNILQSTEPITANTGMNRPGKGIIATPADTTLSAANTAQTILALTMHRRGCILP